MSIFTQLSGTFVNVATVLLGTFFGLLLAGNLPERMQRSLMQVLGLVTFFIGLDMASSLAEIKGAAIPGILLALLSLALGVVLGEALGLEAALTRFGELLRTRFKGGGRFTEGFVAASLLFCIGPMTIIGGMQNGLTGDPSTYVLKGTLDGIAALAMASVYGVGVGFSALVILLLQGGISLAAGALARALGGADLEALASSAQVLLLTGTGGLMIMGIAINLLLAGLKIEDRSVHVSSTLPALILAPLLLWFVGLF